MTRPPNRPMTPTLRPHSRMLALLVLVSVFVFGFASQAVGHSVWIEPDAAGQPVIRFGEPGAKLETSPGHLDGVAPPTAFVFGPDGTPKTLDAPRQRDHFALEGLSSTNVICLETAYAVMITPGNLGRKPVFYARWHPAGSGAARPALTLDLVPTGQEGEVRVFFRGKPLGGVTAALRTPDGKESELRADALGYVRFHSDQTGLHHLSIGRHRESLGGFHGGVAYETTSHNVALTWRQP